MRIVFMGSPESAVPSLEYLVLNGFPVVAVYTRPDRPAGRGRTLLPPPVKLAAARLGLTVLQPPGLKSGEDLQRLADFKPDVIVVCAFGQILTHAVLDIPSRQCLNVHFSLLPRHRGAAPVAAAILAGDEFTGVSTQLVLQKLDTGPVLSTAAVPISPRDNTGTLTARLSLIGANLLGDSLPGWLRGEIILRPKDESAATYSGRIKKDDGYIVWHSPAVDIWRRVRAFYPWPGCYTTWRGKQLKINESAVLPGSAPAGHVLELPGELAVGVGTGEGILGVKTLQLEGRKAMSAEDFLRGQRDFIGARLPD